MGDRTQQSGTVKGGQKEQRESKRKRAPGENRLWVQDEIWD